MTNSLPIRNWKQEIAYLRRTETRLREVAGPYPGPVPDDPRAPVYTQIAAIADLLNKRAEGLEKRQTDSPHG